MRLNFPSTCTAPPVTPVNSGCVGSYCWANPVSATPRRVPRVRVRLRLHEPRCRLGATPAPSDSLTPEPHARIPLRLLDQLICALAGFFSPSRLLTRVDRRAESTRLEECAMHAGPAMPAPQIHCPECARDRAMVVLTRWGRDLCWCPDCEHTWEGRSYLLDAPSTGPESRKRD
jgi:hypothetical protein